MSGGRSFGGGGGGPRPAYGGGFNGQAVKNSLGFHGDDRPNPRLERELFNTEQAQQTGINFDKVFLS